MFVDVADHPATVLATTAAHRELRDVSPAALAAVRTTNRLTGDVVRLHRDVTTQLTEDWYDEVDLLREAVAALERAADRRDSSLVYLPQDLTGSRGGRHPCGRRTPQTSS